MEAAPLSSALTSLQVSIPRVLTTIATNTTNQKTHTEYYSVTDKRRISHVKIDPDSFITLQETNSNRKITHPLR